jgi:hypothetical protein
VAAVLNVTPNHLDRHPGMAHYSAAKANLLRWQDARRETSDVTRDARSGDIAELSADDPVTGDWLRTPPRRDRRRPRPARRSASPSPAGGWALAWPSPPATAAGWGSAGRLALRLGRPRRSR